MLSLTDPPPGRRGHRPRGNESGLPSCSQTPQASAARKALGFVKLALVQYGLR